MNESTQLATVEVQPPSVALMLSETLRAVQSGEVTTQSVEVAKGMMDLYERHEAREAQKAFAAALTALQGETIRVKATKKVDEKNDGTCRYKFAPFETIMATVQPMLTAHGFSVTFDTDITPDGTRLTSICTLTHSGGFSRSNKFAVRFGKPPGSSDAQGDMSTKSYAKRGALCDALNIAIDHDDDARTIGDSISSEEAITLREWVDEVGADKTKFLAFAGAKTFEDIAANRLDALHAELRKREKKP